MGIFKTLDSREVRSLENIADSATDRSNQGGGEFTRVLIHCLQQAELSRANLVARPPEIFTLDGRYASGIGSCSVSNLERPCTSCRFVSMLTSWDGRQWLTRVVSIGKVSNLSRNVCRSRDHLPGSQREQRGRIVRSACAGTPVKRTEPIAIVGALVGGAACVAG